MNQENPTMIEVLTRAIERGAAELRVSMPGRIESFDPQTQTADVKPLLKDSVFDSGEEVVESLPVVPGVPVQFAGGGDFAHTFPVKQGDLCFLVFSDRNLDRWFENGGDTDPVELSRHVITNAVAILGVRDKNAALSEFDPNRAVVGNKGPRVAFDGSAVHIGVEHQEDGSQDSIRGTKFLSELDTLNQSLNQNDTQAGALLQTASGLLQTAAGFLAIPIYGGSLANTPLQTVAQLLLQVGQKLTSNVQARGTFKASWLDYSTNKAKLP